LVDAGGLDADQSGHLDARLESLGHAGFACDRWSNPGAGGGWGRTGLTRMFSTSIGGQVSWLIPSALVLLAVGLWLAALNALYRDVRYVTPFLVQFWMLASPVAYPASLVPEKWRWIYGLNPLAGVIEGFRWALTGHGQAPGPLLFASWLVVAGLLVGGALFFQKMEGVVADVV